MDKLKIFIYTHKDFDVPAKSDSFVILNQGDNVVSDTQLVQLHDNFGIHLKRQFSRQFNELPGMYWVWKNYDLTDVELVGFCHYSRFFMFPKDFSVFNGNYKIILPMLTRYPNSTIYDKYKECHNITDLDLTLEIMKERFPEYRKSADFVANNHFLFPCNMFIMVKADYCRYMDFLFTIITEFIERAGLHTYEDYRNHVIQRWGNSDEATIDYQMGILGFLAERIMTIWVFSNYTVDDMLCMNVANFKNENHKMFDDAVLYGKLYDYTYEI